MTAKKDSRIGRALTLKDSSRMVASYAMLQPHVFWSAALSSLTDEWTGVGGIITAADTMLRKFSGVLEDSTAYGPEVVGHFVDAGFTEVYRQLGDPRIAHDPLRLGIVRDTACLLQGLPSTTFGTLNVDLSKGRKYMNIRRLERPTPFLESTFTRTRHELYGADTPADISDVVMAQLEEFLALAKRSDAAKQEQIYTQSLDLARKYISTTSNPSRLRAARKIALTCMESMRGGYVDAVAQKCSGSETAVAEYRTTYYSLLGDKILGIDGTASLVPAVIKTDNAVVEKIGGSDSEAQLMFLKAASDTYANAVTSPQYDGRTDLKALETSRHISLLTTSPIATSLIEKEPKHGGKQTKTLGPAQEYLYAVAFGRPMKEKGTPFMRIKPKNPDGTSPDAFAPTPAIVGQVGDYVGSSAKKPLQEARFAHTMLAANRLNLLVNPNDRNLTTLRSLVTAATEQMGRKLGGEEPQILYDYLHLVQLVSPQVYAELALLSGVGDRLGKTDRYHGNRIELAHNATQTETDSPFYAAYMASGKMLPGQIRRTTPPNNELRMALNKAIPQETLRSHIGDTDKLTMGEALTVVGEPDMDFHGPLYLLHKATDDESARVGTSWARTSEAIVKKMYGQILGPDGRLTGTEFTLNGKPEKVNFGAAELYITGMLLRETPGEEGAEKAAQEARSRYIPLLVRILSDEAMKTGPKRYAPQLHAMAHHVVRDLIPFFPRESQNEFVAKIIKEILVNNNTAFIEEGTLKSILFPLGYNTELDFPTVVGEVKDRRPIADDIVSQFTALIDGYSWINGRHDRKYLLLDTLGLTIDQLRKTKDHPDSIHDLIQANWDDKSLNLRGRALLQAAAVVLPLDSDENHADFIRVTQEAIKNDILIIAPQLGLRPFETDDFVIAATELGNQAIGSLNRAHRIVRDTVHALASLSNPKMLDDGDILFNGADEHLEPLVKRVREGAKKHYEEMVAASGLPQVEKQAEAVGVSLPRPENDTEQLTSTLKALTTTNEPVQLEQILATFTRLMQPGRQDGNEKAERPSNSQQALALVGGERVAYDIASSVLTLTDAANNADALAKITQAILDHNLAVQQNSREIAEENGTLETTHQQQLLAQQFLRMVSNVLTDREARQTFAIKLNKALEQHELTIAAQARAIDAALKQIEVEGAHEFAQEHINEVRQLIRANIEINQRRRALAANTLTELTPSLDSIAAVAMRANKTAIQILVKKHERQIEFLETLAADDHPLAVCAEAVMAILKSAGVDVFVSMPQAQDLLPSLVQDSPNSLAIEAKTVTATVSN